MVEKTYNRTIRKLIYGLFFISLILLTGLIFASADEYTLQLPSAIQVIEEEAFAYCEGISDIIIPESAKTIKKNAFRGAGYLNSVQFAEGIEEIQSGAFAECIIDTNIFLPSSLKMIAEDAFDETISNFTAEPGTYAEEWINARGWPVWEDGIQYGYIDGQVTVIGYDPDLLDQSSGIVHRITYYINDKPVTKIGPDAFGRQTHSLLSQYLPDTLIEIGDHAFENCFTNRLNSLSIPDSVKTIGAYAFAGCNTNQYSMAQNGELKLGSGITTIGEGAFKGVGKIVNCVEIPAGVTRIEKETFAETSIKQLILSANTETIEGQAFENARINELTIREGSTGIIRASAFDSASIDQLTLPEGIRIEIGAFANASFSQVVLPSNMTIESEMFANAHLGTFTWPASQTIIPEKTFAGGSIDRIDLPEGVLTIQSKAFADCYCKDIYMPDSLTEIADDAFENVNGATYLLPGMTILASRGSYAWNWAIDHGYIPRDPTEAITIDGFLVKNGAITGYIGTETDITIPTEDNEGNPITAIGCYAFRNCDTMITSVIIPEGIEIIEHAAFARQFMLLSIDVPGTVHTIGDYAFYACEKLKTIKGGNSVKTVGKEAFFGCYELLNNVIVNGAETIGEAAFEQCVSLNESLWLRSREIGRAAFNDCKAVRSVQFEESVQSVGDYAFSMPTNIDPRTMSTVRYSQLSMALFKNPDTTLGEGMFSYCVALTSCTLPQHLEAITKRMFYRCEKLQFLSVPYTVKQIGEYAFAYTSIWTLGIPSNVNFIGKAAFRDTPINGVTLPGLLTSIEPQTFQNCTRLEYIEIPDGVKSIGNDAFNGCTSLKGAGLPDSLRTIGDSAFKNCGKLTIITLPSKLNSIGDYAFNGCAWLTDLILPYSLTHIGVKAFANCPNIKAWVIRGSYAEQYCIENDIPFDYLEPLSINPAWYIPTWNQLGDHIAALFTEVTAYSGAKGGIAPYECQFTIENHKGETVYQSYWQEETSMQFIPTEVAEYTIIATVKDQTGTELTARSQRMYAREETEEEKTARLAYIFFSRMQDAFDKVHDPQQTEGYAYYNAFPDEWAWFQQWLSFLSAEVGDMDIYRGEREALFSAIFKMTSTGKSAKLIPMESLPAEVKEITSVMNLSEASFFNSLCGWVNPGENISSSDFKSIFKSFSEGDLSGDAVSEALERIGFTSDQISETIDKMEIFNAIELLGSIAKTYKNTKMIVTAVNEIYNQLVLLESLDMNQYAHLAKTYLGTGSEAQKDIGRVMKQFAEASREEKVLMIIAGKGISVGLDWLLDQIDLTKIASGGAAAVYKVAIATLDVLTGVTKLPEKFHELNYATQNTNTCWNDFKFRRAYFKANPTAESFLNVCYALLDYYQAVVLSEDAFIKLVEKSEAAWLKEMFMGEPLRVAAERAKTNKEKLEKQTASLREIISAWNSVEDEDRNESIYRELVNLTGSYDGY